MSNYFFESFGNAVLEKTPFEFTLPAWDYNNKVVPFETSSFEIIFPYLTRNYGRVPADLNLKFKRLWDVRAREENGTRSDYKAGKISMKLDIDIDLLIG